MQFSFFLSQFHLRKWTLKNICYAPTVPELFVSQIDDVSILVLKLSLHTHMSLNF